jgi:hypothetical protein
MRQYALAGSMGGNSAAADILTAQLRSQQTQSAFRTAGVFLAPVSGFLWGMLVGAVVGPSGGRWDAAIDAGLWSAVVNTGRAVICVPQFMNTPCTILGLPFPTAAAAYVAWQHRKGAR